MENWDDLRFFLAVANEGSVSGAATKLGVNHSTVSRRITAFEESQGVRLFERGKLGVRLTQAAENILERSGEIERIAQGIRRTLVGGDARLQGTITITATSEFATDLLIEPLAALQQAYPDIELHLSMAPGLRNLAAGEADMAIRMAAAPPEDLIGEHIADLQYGLYASTSYLETEKSEHRVIRWEQEACNTDWVTPNFPGARTMLRADALAPIIEAVRAGMGIARLPMFAVRNCDDLVCITRETEPSGRSLWLLTHPDLRSTARVRVCRDFVLRALRAQKSIFEGCGHDQ